MSDEMLELHMSNCKGRPEKRGGGVTCVQCGKLCISPRALKIHHTKTHKKRTENGMFKGSASQTATPMRKVNWATTDPRRQMEIRVGQRTEVIPANDGKNKESTPTAVRGLSTFAFSSGFKLCGDQCLLSEQPDQVTFHDVNTVRGSIGKITFQFLCNACRGERGVARCYRGRAYCVRCCGHAKCD